MSPVKEISVPMAVRTAAILFVFVTVFTALLSGAYLRTKPAIEASAADEKMKLVDEVLPRSEIQQCARWTIPCARQQPLNCWASPTRVCCIVLARTASRLGSFLKLWHRMVMPERFDCS